MLARATRSLHRLTPVTLALLLAVPTSGIAQSYRYAQGGSQYRVTSKTMTTQTAMGQSQDMETSSEQLVSVTVRNVHQDTLQLTARMDSLKVVGPMGMTPPGMEQLVGFSVDARISPFGLVYSAKGSNDTIPDAQRFTDELSRILPRIRGELTAGSSWTDTTTGTVNQGGIDINREVVTKFTVVGDTSVSGQQAWNIKRETTVKLQGSGNQGGQALTLAGTTTGTGNLALGRNGAFLGSVFNDAGDITVVLLANGMEVGITQTAETRIEKIR